MNFRSEDCKFAAENRSAFRKEKPNARDHPKNTQIQFTNDFTPLIAESSSFFTPLFSNLNQILCNYRERRQRKCKNYHDRMKKKTVHVVELPLTSPLP